MLLGVPIDGGGVLCSETADGPTLADRIAVGPRMAVVDALRVAAQLCAALEAAGDRGGTEIDPADLRIAPGGLLKVMRWGWSDADSEPRNPAAYRAPEEEHAAGDTRPLVYAVGAILVLALSGDEEIARAAHDEETWSTFVEKTPDLPGAVRLLAKRATALDPSKRFPSVKGLRLGLANLLKQVQRRASGMGIPTVG